ncbi:hypothetical protein TanjilG_03678 [Lupinus angustifolius]|uniref:Uncharacterized protein n=1 Tax=Lupinus angustifolius TaxID=3871 RepID=A0A1J7HSB3_LUPAN|nr:hypothetical protein TanjilG_03678 [Lupinus angustifolius]
MARTYLARADRFPIHEVESRDDNENRTRGYPSEPNPNLTVKTRCDWVRVKPDPNFRVRIRVWYN